MSAELYHRINSTFSLESKESTVPTNTPTRTPPLRAQKKCLDESTDFKKLDYALGLLGDYGGGVARRQSEDEEVLRENPNRFTLFPIHKPHLYKKYKDHIAVFWHADEVDLSKDMKDWMKLTADEQHFIKYVLAFFAGSDGIVMENLGSRFMREVQLAEARAFYAIQMAIEQVHSEMYSLLIDTYLADDPKSKDEMFRAIHTVPCIGQKAAWAQRWIEGSSASFATRLVAFAAVEGIFFSGSFCAIYWLKQRGLMPGLTVSNEFISRDEGLHTDFACALYGELKGRLATETVHQIIREAVSIEKHFITEALPCALIGMNAELMKQYIEYVADRLCQQLGYPKIWNGANPFDFMERISLESKDNFFEKRVTTYAKAGVGASAADKAFCLNADF
jgi:ribonucleotide reductase beta subunit family protein with ferritin-like domain